MPPLLPVVLPGPARDNSHVLPWVQPPMCWKDHLILDRYGPPLPVDRCCRCNTPTTRSLRQTFSSRAILVFLLVALLPPLLPIVLLIYFLVRCRATIEFGICPRCANRRLLGRALGVAIVLTSVPLFTQAFLHLQDSRAWWWALPGVFAVGLGLFVTSAFSSLATARRVDQRWVVLKGLGKPYRESLPKSPIPQF